MTAALSLVTCMITIYCSYLLLGVTYLDENLTAKMSSLYVGIFFAVAIFGPAVGYILGGYFLSLFTDFDSVDSSE